MSIPGDPINGAYIIGELLRADNGLTALVPAENIKLGAIPDGTALPVMLIRLISSVAREGLSPNDATPTFDRVAVLVRAKNYREKCLIINLLKDACRGQRGGFDTGLNYSVRLAGTGPDLRGPADSYEQTQDFRLFYNS